MLARRRLLGTLMGLVLAACATPPDATPPPTPPSPPPSPTPAAQPSSEAPTPTGTAASSTPTPGLTAPPIAVDPPPIGFERVVGGLASPIGVAPVPDGRLLVNERAGRVIAVDPSSGAHDVALDITDRVLGRSEQGLLGLVLHPSWPDDDRVFVHYTSRDGATVLAAFETTSTDPIRIGPASERELLRHPQPFANHNGGQLAFGPDGYLYVGLGDGGAGGDPLGNGQNPNALLGSVLRLDVGAGGDDPYAIPDDNPFVDGGGAPEVFLYGLRNPWRFSFDRRTGQLWIGDVGQNAFEEIDRVDPVADAGANLGWNVMEASHCYADRACDPAAFLGPVTEYGRDAGCSVTGGYVYRGEAIDGLAGWYLFGDYCSGTVFGIPSDVPGLTPPRVLSGTDVSITSFGEDAVGELYLTDINGSLYRIVGGG